MLTPENRVGSWLNSPTLEMLPNGTSAASLASIPPEIPHSITNLKTESVDTTLNFTLELARQGRNAVPHISTSRISREKAIEVGSVLVEHSIDHVFIINGDNDGDATTYPASLDLLEDLYENGIAFGKIGIAGHPEGHPDVPEHILDQALKNKQELARQTGAEMYVVTQMCFDPSAISSWIRHIRGEGITLPVFVGVPGPIDLNRLAAYSGICGVGESIDRLATEPHLSMAGGLDMQRKFDPYNFLHSLAEIVPEDGIQGAYLFTFNDPSASQEWLDGVQANL